MSITIAMPRTLGVRTRTTVNRFMPHTDLHTELLTATGTGDRDAFARLYDLVAGPVFGTIRGILRDPSMAEEVTQEVLVEVWRTAPRFDPERGSAKAWILTMARRRAIDRVRSEQSHRDRTENVGAASRDPERDTTYDAVERAAEHAELRRALDGLTDLQRDAIERAYLEGKTYREVAEELDTPLGTVKTRMRDGLLRLRDTLGAPS